MRVARHAETDDLGDRARTARRGVLNLLKGSSGSVRSEIETLARKLYVAI